MTQEREHGKVETVWLAPDVPSHLKYDAGQREEHIQLEDNRSCWLYLMDQQVSARCQVGSTREWKTANQLNECIELSCPSDSSSHSPGELFEAGSPVALRNTTQMLLRTKPPSSTFPQSWRIRGPVADGKAKSFLSVPPVNLTTKAGGKGRSHRACPAIFWSSGLSASMFSKHRYACHSLSSPILLLLSGDVELFYRRPSSIPHSAQDTSSC
ncbi:hypothetical protein CPB84DRAFT_1848881 [Gymnopilus junonius]|uniref:Uncharacterized protein n=1 Tax=Gymnopilus junonius TaxID=109634 RepID=A0A9P5NK19_GYMJU|nr:hypothetical protein CPB84DRAFT_1848881 [Gymnopilus junonius]